MFKTRRPGADQTSGLVSKDAPNFRASDIDINEYRRYIRGLTVVESDEQLQQEFNRVRALEIESLSEK